MKKNLIFPNLQLAIFISYPIFHMKITYSNLQFRYKPSFKYVRVQPRQEVQAGFNTEVNFLAPGSSNLIR
jgi:hypothetical protein